MSAPSAAPSAFSAASGVAPDRTAAGVRDTILVVEDEDSIAGLIGCILARGNFRVVRARDGEECLRLLEENETHLLLATLDCKLPDADGGALCQRVRERAAALPVLFVSGCDVSKLKAAWAGDRRTGFVAKPFLPGEVLKQVRALVGSGPA
ncbi:MAG: response regulator [Opitutaceae bacterium]